MSKSHFILALFLMLPLAHAAASWAPAVVVAVDLADAQAVVTWAPGETLADAYRVYGVSEGSPRLLAEVPPATGEGRGLLVPGGYADYAVSGILDGVESELVYAAEPACVTYEEDPPSVTVTPDCIKAVTGRVKGVLHS